MGKKTRNEKLLKNKNKIILKIEREIKWVWLEMRVEKLREFRAQSWLKNWVNLWGIYGQILERKKKQKPRSL